MCSSTRLESNMTGYTREGRWASKKSRDAWRAKGRVKFTPDSHDLTMRRKTTTESKMLAICMSVTAPRCTAAADRTLTRMQARSGSRGAEVALAVGTARATRELWMLLSNRGFM